MKKKEKTNQITQADIKTGYTCNNSCLFCLNADKKKFSDLNTSEIKEKIISAKKLGVKSIGFSGGEPTIRKDFLEICNAVFKEGLMLEVQTNARMFYYEKFASKFTDLPVRFLVSIHGNEKTHNFLTRTDSFQQTLEGIKNLKKNNLFVITNTIVNSRNYRLLPELSLMLDKLGVNQIQFTWMRPMGNALHNYHNLSVSYSEVLPSIKRVNKMNKKNILFINFPYCLDRNIKIARMPKKKEFETYGVYDSELLKKEYQKFPFCSKCAKGKECSGVYKKYAECFGNSEFKPVLRVY